MYRNFGLWPRSTQCREFFLFRYHESIDPLELSNDIEVMLARLPRKVRYHSGSTVCPRSLAHSESLNQAGKNFLDTQYLARLNLFGRT